MKSLAIVYRNDSDEALKLSNEVKAYLRHQPGFTVHSFSSRELTDGCFSELKPVPEVVLVLGGDGTYLSASRALENLSIPLVGVNLGSLGFLTENKSSDVYTLIDRILEGKLKTSSRTLMTVDIFKNGKSFEKKKALNDIVIERGARSQLLRIKVFCGNQLVSDLKADGLIVSSATGSTAYNLAAGGPILFPETPAFSITPVAPHSLTSRPIVVPDSLDLRLQLFPGEQVAQLTIDGIRVTDIDPEFEIKIKKSEQGLLVLKDPYYNYFDLLREKLKFGERA